MKLKEVWLIKAISVFREYDLKKLSSDVRAVKSMELIPDFVKLTDELGLIYLVPLTNVNYIVAEPDKKVK